MTPTNPAGSFDLDRAISSWKRSLRHWRAFLDDDLDELESHLRDHVESLCDQGYGLEDSFRTAVESLGGVDQMERAYKEVFWRKVTHRRLLLASLVSHISMFKNYVLIGFRSLLRHPGYSTVNIAGLALGLTCAFLIVLWIQSEYSVDRFHEHADDLYTVRIKVPAGDRVTTWPNVPAPLAQVMENDYPEIERAVLTLPVTTVFDRDSRSTREEAYFAGPGFFEAFTFPFVAGDPATALQSPGSVVLSESVAMRYFGDGNIGAAVGQPLPMVQWRSHGGVLGEALTVDEAQILTVTGVFRTPSERSSLAFDAVLPMQDVISQFPHTAQWGPRWFELIVQTIPEADPDELSLKLESLLGDHAPGSENEEILLQPFRDAYLYNRFEDGIAVGGRIRQLYLLGMIGLAILLMACVNFANLVTARAGQRAREIGVRKAVGASPSYLTQQFLSEAVLTTLCAFALSVVLVVLALPLFRLVTGLQVDFSGITAGTWLSLGGIAVLTGCLAGSYPAFYLASLDPMRALRSERQGRKRGEIGLRKGLVLFQFGISTVLVLGTLTVYKQLVYLQSAEAGLDRANVLITGVDASQPFGVLRETLLQSPAIESVARVSENPVGVSIKNGQAMWEGKGEEETLLFTVLRGDAHVAEALNLQMVQGRFFDEERDRGGRRFVINRAAAAAMGLESPLGHPFGFEHDLASGGLGEIVGVVDDFHTGSLTTEAVGPLVLRYEPEAAHFLLVKSAPGRSAEAISILEAAKRSQGEEVFEYQFLDDTYQAYYADERVLSTLSRLFALAALFIACLGLVGLSAFSVQQRTKEIGIRRVLGAPNAHVLVLLSRELLSVVGFALVLSLPIGFWVMNSWLSSFANRVEIGGGTVLFAAAGLLGLAALSVGYQGYRALRLDPARSLHSE